MKLYSIPEAASRVGISRQRLYELVKEGKVVGTRVGREYAISAREVARLEQKVRLRKRREAANREFMESLE